MLYCALATDYDGTLAHQGKVDLPTLDALGRLKKSGRKLILVTGRELEELFEVFPHLDRFDRVVAENGAVLYRPADRSETILADRPPDSFVEELKTRGVGPISVGRVIVATWQPHQEAVVEAIRDAGLNLQVILNKRAVMILPSGVDKATGLAVTLRELDLSPRSVVAIGDAENDLAFLGHCGFAVAVANALPILKECAHLVTRGDHGAGVSEVINRLLIDDLKSATPPESHSSRA